MELNKTLFLFTATYPYGKSEVFLEDEIIYLATYFKRVVIVPLTGEKNDIRTVPDNCEVLTPITNNRLCRYTLGLLGLRSLPVFLSDFWKHRVFVNKARFKAWLVAYSQSNILLHSRTIRRIFNSISIDDICYFYWGKGSNIISVFYKNRAKFVSRFHGEWDLWEESSGSYAPIRKQVASCLTSAVFISKLGETYFKNRYPYCSTCFIPLGSPDYGMGQKSTDGVLRVVSCSSVYPLKRVHYIFEALKLLRNCRIIWTHIGGGSDFKNLEELVHSIDNDNIEIVLKGRMAHDEVLQYYRTHPADVFVNVSTNEGVPVSIMEALSFNIPVVATNVGGNSEIVTPQSGILIDANPTPKQIADAILQSQKQTFNARDFWMSHYSAEHNYSKMADLLIHC